MARLLAAYRVRSWAIGLPRPNLRDLPAWTGMSSAAVGVIVLLGWLLDAPVLKSILPELPNMKANTAVCLVLIGIGVVLVSRANLSSAGHRLGLAMVGAAGVIALVTGIQYVTGTSLGIDEALVRDPLEAGAAGRMAPLTLLCFVALAPAVMAGRRAPRITIALSSLALLVSLLNVLTFVFDAAPPPILAGYVQMALSTAIAIGILAVGVLGLLGPESPFVLLVGQSPAAKLLRGVLAMLVAIPAFMIWITLKGQHLGLYEADYGTALRLLGIAAIAAFAIFRSADWVRDLDAKREAVEMERDRFFELSLDMLSVIGADGRFRRVNHAWETVLGHPDGELIGRSHMEFVHPDDMERTMAEASREYGAGEDSLGFQNRYRHHDGSYRWLEWMSRPSPDGSVAYGVARDVTERKRKDDRRARQQRVMESRNEELTHQAVRDQLTGLYNRRHFDQAVTQMERRWSRSSVDSQLAVSVIIFDLDHFGEVNKQFGHQAGDAVLKAFAGLLTRRFRESDLVARYGGEEFVAVLEGATANEALRIAEDIRAAFEASPTEAGMEGPLVVTVSAGCAQLGSARKVSAGLAMADVWLAQAKRAGRNQVVGL